MGNDLKVIIKLLQEINARLDRLENKDMVIGNKGNRAMRVRIKPIRLKRGVMYYE